MLVGLLFVGRREMKRRSHFVVGFVSACFAARVAGQSPWPQGPPFAAIASLAGFSEGSSQTQPADLDVRVSLWSGLAVAPMPYLRISLRGNDVDAQTLRWWRAGWLDPQQAPTGANVRCEKPAATCIELRPTEAVSNWPELAATFAASGPCRAPYVPSTTPPPPPPPTDTWELHGEIVVNGAVRKYVCLDPETATGPGARVALELFRLLEGMRRQ